MYGRRLPYLDVLWSDKTPMMGWTTSPESGPATHTRLKLLLDMPSESKNGLAYVNSVPQQNDRPTMESVRRNMRMVSLEPLTCGCPIHDGDAG